jgi:hypothetical protein
VVNTPILYNENSINEDIWTINYLIDAMKKHLANVKQSLINVDEGCDNKERVESRKYYDQAYKMLKIGAFRPAPPYIISLRDLTPKMIKELYSLDIDRREYALKQAVGRIFEDLNCDIYHNSVSRVLKVQLV